MFVAIFKALDGVAYLESQNLAHGDLTPCSVTVSGLLLDYLRINKLVEIAQGHQKLIYDAPDNYPQNQDVWALGITILETVISIERCTDGTKLLMQLELNQ